MPENCTPPRLVTARRRRAQSGNHFLESALVFMGFMFLVLGIEEFGRMVFAFNFVSEAATEGARWASVRGSSSASPATNATITSYVNQWAAGLDTANVTVVATWTPDNNPGGKVQVNVTYAWTAIVGKIVPSTINFTGTSTMLILQ